MDAVSVVLVDDHPLVRAGIRSLLDPAPDMAVVGEAGSKDEALEVVGRTHPHVVLLDIRLRDGNGIDIVDGIRALSPQSAVVILSSYFNVELVRLGRSHGVAGYLVKDAEQLDLVSAVRVVAGGGAVYDPRVLCVDVPEAVSGAGVLTPRELQVLEGVCKGLSNAEIARDLDTTEGTVKGYVSSIMRKFACDSRVQLVIKARELHIV